MREREEPVAGRRLAATLDYLGIERAHFAVGGGSEPQAFELILERPSVAASLTILAVPPVMDRRILEMLADRTVCITGEPVTPPQRLNLELIRGWKGAQVIDLPDYVTLVWSDLVHDHTDLVVETLVNRELAYPVPAVSRKPEEGVLDGVRFRLDGSGPPLLLFPIGLAPTQWDAALPRLNERFTTLRLSGEHLGFVQFLEERAAGGTYIQGVRTMFDLLGISPGDRVLEVGTGTGALARDLAAGRFAPTEIVAVDINEFLLEEARFLAGKQARRSKLSFQYGNAESLPFEDESFDVAFAATVIEECNADKAIAELHRVLKPGGRAGAIVRARDLPRYWNVAASKDISVKLNAPFPESAASEGCADASLCERFARRFTDVQANPFWRCTMQIPANTLGQALALLGPSEAEEFKGALAAGLEAGTTFAATPFHCTVGTKP